MEILMELISYFGIEMIGEAETFPQLLQSFLTTMLAIYLVVIVITELFKATWHIGHDLNSK
jgi:hypothetical protein